MNKHIYEKIIIKYEQKILSLAKRGKNNSEVYNLYKQMINDLKKKTEELNAR